jgi:hypothetical protein
MISLVHRFGQQRALVLDNATHQFFFVVVLIIGVFEVVDVTLQEVIRISNSGTLRFACELIPGECVMLSRSHQNAFLCVQSSRGQLGDMSEINIAKYSEILDSPPFLLIETTMHAHIHTESKNGRLRNVHDLCAQRASSAFGIDQSQIAFRYCAYADFHSVLPFLRPYHK